MSTSHTELLPLLRRVATPASAAIMLDVHTGLGPSGVDTLIPPLMGGVAGHAANAAAIQRIFGGEVAPSAAGGASHVRGVDFLIDVADPSQAAEGAASSGYELTRGSTEGYLERLGDAGQGAGVGWARALHVTQEFGTLAGPLVLRGMAIERVEWLYGGETPEAERGTQSRAVGCNGTVRGASAAQNAFYVRRASWQRKVVRRGVRLAEQAVAALAQQPDLVPGA